MLHTAEVLQTSVNIFITLTVTVEIHLYLRFVLFFLLFIVYKFRCHSTLVLTAEGPQLTFSPTMKIMITILNNGK